MSSTLAPSSGAFFRCVESLNRQVQVNSDSSSSWRDWVSLVADGAQILSVLIVLGTLFFAYWKRGPLTQFWRAIAGLPEVISPPDPTVSYLPRGEIARHFTSHDHQIPAVHYESLKKMLFEKHLITESKFEKGVPRLDAHRFFADANPELMKCIADAIVSRWPSIDAVLMLPMPRKTDSASYGKLQRALAAAKEGVQVDRLTQRIVAEGSDVMGKFYGKEVVLMEVVARTDPAERDNLLEEAANFIRDSVGARLIGIVALVGDGRHEPVEHGVSRVSLFTAPDLRAIEHR